VAEHESGPAAILSKPADVPTAARWALLIEVRAIFGESAARELAEAMEVVSDGDRTGGLADY
jgi:hypothetical protein